MDRMTVLGTDGKPKYEIEGTEVKDMKVCSCTGYRDLTLKLNGATDPREITVDYICQLCGLPVKSLLNPERNE